MHSELVTRLLLDLHSKRDIPEKPYSEHADIIAARDSVLKRFQTEFAPNSLETLSATTFQEFLSFKHNQHWTGLQRPTAHACDDMPKLRNAIAYLFDESEPISIRIDKLTSQQSDIYIPGINKAVLSPLLLIKYPDKYGVWNGKAEAALKTLRIWPNFPKRCSIGQRYELINQVLQTYSDSTGLDLWSIDGVWHVVNAICTNNTIKDLQDDTAELKELTEGTKRLTSGIIHERNPEARKKCIEHHGTLCKVCGFDFFETYGDLGFGFIHVHHVQDIALRGESTVNPKTDLIPVCPNCHAMLHRGTKPARCWKQLRRTMRTKFA